jgi:hypothetical protein
MLVLYWREHHIENNELFPEGQLVNFIDGKVVGSVAILVV